MYIKKIESLGGGGDGQLFRRLAPDKKFMYAPGHNNYDEKYHFQSQLKGIQ